jgi:hypothetical protein
MQVVRDSEDSKKGDHASKKRHSNHLRSENMKKIRAAVPFGDIPLNNDTLSFPGSNSLLNSLPGNNDLITFPSMAEGFPSQASNYFDNGASLPSTPVNIRSKLLNGQDSAPSTRRVWTASIQTTDLKGNKPPVGVEYASSITKYCNIVNMPCFTYKGGPKGDAVQTGTLIALNHLLHEEEFITRAVPGQKLDISDFKFSYVMSRIAPIGVYNSTSSVSGPDLLTAMQRPTKKVLFNVDGNFKCVNVWADSLGGKLHGAFLWFVLIGFSAKREVTDSKNNVQDVYHTYFQVVPIATKTKSNPCFGHAQEICGVPASYPCHAWYFGLCGTYNKPLYKNRQYMSEVLEYHPFTRSDEKPFIKRARELCTLIDMDVYMGALSPEKNCMNAAPPSVLDVLNE